MKKLLYTLSLALLATFANAQVKIGSNPGTIGSSSNLEVEASNGNKTVVDKSTGNVTVNGKITIVDGTQGAGKLLASDANGGASWQTLTQQTIPVTVFVGTLPSSYTLTPAGGFNTTLSNRIPLAVRSGSASNYSTATKVYTIQETAYYRIHAGARFVGTSGQTGTSVRLYLEPSGVLAQFDEITNGTGPTMSVFWEGYLTAGTTVNPFGVVFPNYTTNTNGTTYPLQNVVVADAFCSVTKLF